MTAKLPVTWVIGASGLLGRATSTLAERRGHLVLRRLVPWDEGLSTVGEALRVGTDQLLAHPGADRWNVVWVAGAGVVGTAADELARESRTYTELLNYLAHAVGRRDPSRVSLFLASSGGGVYAGSSAPPFTEFSPVQPLSAYGSNKLEMEGATRVFTERSGVGAVIGRISNLYGPGQNIAKPQGLVSQLARAYLLHEPMLLYVPLDTIRDYLYVGDCARKVLAALDRLSVDTPPTEPVVKVLASGRATTISELLGVFRRVFKRRAPLVLGNSPHRKLQVRDLRMRSTVWPEVDSFMTTPLPVGVWRTVNDLAARLRVGELPKTA